MDNIVKNITVGIRHKRIFKIRDNFGKFIDCILHNEDSPFSIKFFPFIDEKVSDSVVLHNEDGEHFQINTDDFILRLKTRDDFEKNVAYVVDKVLPFLKKRIFNITKIDGISRVGIVFSLEFLSKDKINKLISFFTEKNIESINNFEMRFTKKLSVGESLSKKGVNDYISVIYTLVKKKDKMLVNFDYQRYFKPELKDINDFDLGKFVESAVNNLKDTYEKWLKNYEEEQSEDNSENSSKEGGEREETKEDIAKN
jgi:hypothetical protein